MTRAPVRIFDNTLTLKTELDNYSSLLFTRAWYGIGDFSITMSLSVLHADEIARGRILCVDNDPYKCGIITEITKSIDNQGKETVTASGFELRHAFSWRRVVPAAGQARWEHTGAVETILKNMVYAQAGAGAAANRRIPLLTMAADLGRGASYLVSARYSALSEEVEQAAWATNIGPHIYIDFANKLFMFDVAEGVDRTSEQVINGRAIFSPDWDTLETAGVTESDIEYRNYALVGGQGIGAARTIVPVYAGAEPTGWARREMWIDARDLSASGDLTARGNSKLSEKAFEDYLEATILPYSPLKYQTDYDIGDLCTISALGKTVDARISEAQESWDESGYSLALTFGKPYPEAQIIAAKNNESTTATLAATEQ